MIHRIQTGSPSLQSTCRSSSAVSVSFGYSKGNLKHALHLLDHQLPQVQVQNSQHISIPLLEKALRVDGHIPSTRSFRLSRKIENHPVLEELRKEQVQKAGEIILQNAKKDGTEVIITDLDGTILTEGTKRAAQRNFLKDPISTFLVMTGLSRKHPATRKIYLAQDAKWKQKHFAPPILSTVNFLKQMQQNNIKIIGVTARPEVTKHNTLANLQAIGLTMDHVFFHPEMAGADNRFKPKLLQQLSKKHKILGVLGDQYQDLIPPDRNGFNFQNTAKTVNILLTNPHYTFSGFLY